MNQTSIGVIALVTHARTVPSDAREAFGDAAAALGDDPRVIVLRTCHRVEVYAAWDPAGPEGPPELPDLPAGGRRLEEHDAIRHLFAVAAGFDSIVVGEDQILTRFGIASPSATSAGSRVATSNAGEARVPLCRKPRPGSSSPSSTASSSSPSTSAGRVAPGGRVHRVRSRTSRSTASPPAAAA